MVRKFLKEIIRCYVENYANFLGPFKYADVRDYRGLERIIVEDNIDWVVSLGKLLHKNVA